MRSLKHLDAIVTVLLVLTCFACNLAAQEDNKQEQDKTRETQKAEKKSVEAQGERTATGVEPLSNSLSSYRVDFTLTEVNDGKRTNARNYSLITQVGHRDKLRVGGRVPVATTEGPSLPQMQFQYLDIGMNIDCTVQELDGAVLLTSTIEASSVAPQRDEQTHQPVIRQMRFEIRTVLSPGKPTMISSMDDPTSKERFQVEVTATKVR
jgi:hypothetical protein